MLGKMLLTIVLAWCVLSLGQAREETTVEECEKNIAPSLKSRICELRQYKTVQGKDMDNHMQCVLEVIGFVEDTGDVVFQDLLAVLKTIDSSPDHLSNLKQCNSEADRVDSTSKANTFYTCILGTSSSETFRKAFNYGGLTAADGQCTK
ncbi:uncharacterized protein LOC118517250 [Anopheles stephensi]|uniref:uncharacterized protein LOC118517250 n=1 Tax=Anopheles stephensi TaxID=30069 RepID=UPI001658937A|nr:uncharacterized protein LOC118517250 [Anopheles stephensi]